VVFVDILGRVFSFIAGMNQTRAVGGGWWSMAYRLGWLMRYVSGSLIYFIMDGVWSLERVTV